MASGQELLYTVRLKASQGDIANIEKELEKLDKKSGKKDTGVREQKEFNASLKETKKAYQELFSPLKKLRAELKGYQEDLAIVQETSRQSGGATAENVQLQKELGQAITDTKTKIEAASRGNVDYESSLTQSGGSIREMKGRLRALKIAIDNVEDPLGKGAERVQELTAEHDTLNTTIGNVEKTMGVHTRNVGNYEDGIRSAANAVAIFQGPLGPLAGRINSAATAISRFRQAQATATKSTITLGRAIKMTLVSTGIGALIVAITSLLAFFRRTERGQQALRVGGAALSAVFETFADVAVRVGEALFNAFNNPKQALSDLFTGVVNLGQTIISSLVDRVKAVPDVYIGVFKTLIGNFKLLGARVRLALSDVPILGDFIDTEKAQADFLEASKQITEGAKKTAEAYKTIFNVDFLSGAFEGAKDFIKTIGDNIKDNTRNQREMNDILVRERELLVERAQMERDTARAREDSRNLDIEAEKRLESLLAVRAREEEMLEKELNLERDRLRVMQEQLDRFESTEEQIRELAEQEAKLFRMEEEHAKTMMSLTRDQAAVERQIRERNMREARLDFDQRMGFRNLEIEAEAQKLEMMGRMLEAERLRQAESEAEFTERKNLRLAQLEAEFINQKFSAERAAELAQNQFKIEEGERLLQAKKRLSDLEMQAEQQKLQAISNFIGSANKAFFGDAKSLAVAQTIIDTYAGVQKALAAPPGFPFNAVNAAAVAAQGVANVRKILSTNLDSKAVDSASAQVPTPKASFGLVDIPGIGGEIASQQAPAQNLQPNIILEGEFDPEFLSIKVRQGNDSISGRVVTI
jgi:myosin heavy subunit